MLKTIFRSFAFFALPVLALAAVGSAQTQITGDWQGKLIGSNGSALRLVFHITAAKDGTLSASIDSLDQNASGIPVSSITLQGDKLTLLSQAVRGSYEGTVSSDGSSINGMWSQGMPLPLNLTRAEARPVALPAPPSDIDGEWAGTVQTGTDALRIVLKITNTTGGLTAQLQSPDQSPAWINASGVMRGESSLSVEFKSLGAVYEGKIGADGASIDGTFTQKGHEMPLVLAKK